MLLLDKQANYIVMSKNEVQVWKYYLGKGYAEHFN